MIPVSFARWRGVARAIQKAASATTVILLYHRVADGERDPWGLCVSPKNFAEHLAVLRRSAWPISLEQLTRHHATGRVPKRGIVVTFDDGYADNLYQAKPLLELHDVPATVFAATGPLDSGRAFWWDELERILLEPRRLPSTLRLEVNTQDFEWELGAASECERADVPRNGESRPWEAEPGSRLGFYYAVWQQLRPLTEAMRRPLLDRLAAWAYVEHEARPAYRAMDVGELRRLAAGGLVEIGAHTVTHPLLSANSTAFQKAEIEGSKNRLEQILERSVSSFAYPYGDYSPESIPLVSAAGFRCACSVVQQSVWHRTDGFQFPRFPVGDWNGEEFEKRLSRWFWR
jgi:peptidoglycan/xylan/chitin deacetylase (PgdA/CDA1 family)